jgi:hypothetical protein
MSTGEPPSELVSRAFKRRTASLGRVRFDDHKPSVSEAILQTLVSVGSQTLVSRVRRR